jgi:hypothetical protein
MLCFSKSLSYEAIDLSLHPICEQYFHFVSIYLQYRAMSIDDK